MTARPGLCRRSRQHTLGDQSALDRLDDCPAVRQIVCKVMIPRFEAGNYDKVAEVVAGVAAVGGRIGCKRASNWALQLSAA